MWIYAQNSPKLLLLKFLPLNHYHSHFLAATLDFTTFSYGPFCTGATPFTARLYNIIVYSLCMLHIFCQLLLLLLVLLYHSNGVETRNWELVPLVRWASIFVYVNRSSIFTTGFSLLACTCEQAHYMNIIWIFCLSVSRLTVVRCVAMQWNCKVHVHKYVHGDYCELFMRSDSFIIMVLDCATFPIDFVLSRASHS